MAKQITQWYIHYPGDVYSLGPVGPFRTEREVRAWAREWSEVERLPRGWACWRA